MVRLDVERERALDLMMCCDKKIDGLMVKDMDGVGI